MSRTQISDFLVDEVTEHVYIRETYGKTLVELGREYPNIVVLDADLTVSTKTNLFGKEFPNRFFTMGVSEQDMMATAAGFALSGKIPFASTFAIFATGRAWEHVRQSIVFPKLNVKIVATHAGVTVGEDGATHQALEDIALMRVLPNMTVIVPADAVETEKVIRTIVNHNGPTYVRLARVKFPTIFKKSYEFEIGKARVLREGKHVTIFKAASSTGAVVTAEDHNIVGGLGGAIAEVLGENYPTPMKRIGMKDRFGTSGDGLQLLEYFGLKARNIVQAAHELLEFNSQKKSVVL